MKDENNKDELYQQIIREYEKTGSVKQVVENLNSNTIKVRRVLITEGLWESNSSRAVCELHEQGLSVSEIAKKLCMSEKNVQSYLPYTRGTYGGTKTNDAERSIEYRERMKNAAEHQASIAESGEMGEMKKMPKKENKIIEFPENKTEPAAKPMGRFASALKLKFELVESFHYGGKSLEHDDDKIKRFLKNAKAENGIIREVLVPGEMNLHAMHYMIQKLFGWQNSHLHRFSISEEDFDDMTDGQKLTEYLRLCGTIFKFPSGDLNDRFWDDDYEDGMSVKTWLRHKYNWGVRDHAVEDSYIRNQIHVQDLKKRYAKELKKNPNMTIPELEEKVMFDDPFNTILESIQVRNIFKMCTPNDLASVKSNKGFQELLINQIEDKIETLKKEDPEEYNAILQAMDYLVELRANILNIDKAIRYGQAADVKKFYKEEPIVVLYEQKNAVKELQEILFPYMSADNPIALPFADALYYIYDYGDDWCVKITCEDVYIANENYDFMELERRMNDKGVIDMSGMIPAKDLHFTDKEGNQVDEELREKLHGVYPDREPLCILADGLNVMDDVGGIWRYMDFLELINSKDPKDAEEKEDYKSWAKGMGWTGRKTKPENIL